MTTITSQDRLETLAANVIHREREVFSYQINVDNYTAMLAALPDGDWPAEIVQYKTTSINALPAEMAFATVQQVSEYQHRDHLRQLLRTERVEQGKSQRVYDAMVSQIPADQYDALIAAALVKINAPAV